VPGSSETIDQLWQPDMSATIRYARGRTGDIWGETSVTARDQTRFFLDIDGDVDVDERHRSYAMRLLRSVIPSERWGIAVLTMYDGSHAYGKQTLRGVFSRLLRRFPSGRSDRDDLR
jgi:hypothetical protein